MRYEPRRYAVNRYEVGADTLNTPSLAECTCPGTAAEGGAGLTLLVSSRRHARGAAAPFPAPDVARALTYGMLGAIFIHPGCEQVAMLEVGRFFVRGAL